MSGLTTEDLACRKGIRTQDLGPGLQMPGRKKNGGGENNQMALAHGVGIWGEDFSRRGPSLIFAQTSDKSVVTSFVCVRAVSKASRP